MSANGSNGAAGKNGKPKAKKKRGRPRVEFDLQQVEKLGEIGASYEEMAGFLGCHYHLIQNRMQEEVYEKNPETGADVRIDTPFQAAYKRGFAKVKISLRRQQIRRALGQSEVVIRTEDGQEIVSQRAVPSSDKLLMFLGVQILGQQSQMTVNHTGGQQFGENAAKLARPTQEDERRHIRELELMEGVRATIKRVGMLNAPDDVKERN